MMDSKTRAHSAGALALLGGLLLFGAGGSPAFAQTSGDGLAETAPAPIAATGSLDEDTTRLQALVGTQTHEEIMAIVDSGDPYIAYADAGGEYLSAFAKPKPDPLVQGRSISIRGPGCGTGDACAIGAYKYGYYGTGQKSVSLTGITSLTAGTNNTTWWYSATKGYNIKPNGQLVLAAKTSFVSITRS